MAPRSAFRAAAVFCGLILLSSAAAAKPAVSPALRALDALAPGEAPLTAVPTTDVPGVGLVVDLFLEGNVSESELAARGVTIGSRLPNGVMTARVPLSRLGEVIDAPGLTRMSAGQKVQLHHDASVPSTQATPNFWTAAPPNFTGNAGAGVIVGIVDTGIDWTHGDFKHPDGTTRILNIWDQNDLVGPNPPGFAYGSHWTAADINAGTPRQVDANGHGTHVAGSAAGDGSATGNGQPANRFIGMAPRADIIFVATNFNSTGVVDGVNFIFQRAAALGRPAVVNLSLGNQFGAHDGTETFDTAIDALTGPGKIVVVSAGNDGNSALHAEQLVPPGPAQTVTFSVPAYTANGGTGNDYVIIDAYYQGSANMQVTLTSPGPSPVTVGPVSKGANGANAASLAGNIYMENGFTPSPSGDANIFIQIYDSNASRPPRQGTWTITLTPVATLASTECDLWQSQHLLGAAGAVPVWTSDVDESELVGSPGSATQAITVAAHVTKVTWPSIDGNNYTYSSPPAVGAIAPFSSPGPRRDGGQKPDISAPGMGIVSAKSMSAAVANPWINPDGVHFTNQGTSMSSPHVAGGVALLLADQPALTPAQIKTKLAADAVTDGFTGAVWNKNFGNGKLRMIRVDTTAPTVTVTAPNGGENWLEGSSQAITWNAADNVGVTSVDIDWSANGGGSWSAVAAGEVNDGTCSWTVPATTTTQALVRVTARDAAANSTADASNAVFTISSASASPVDPALLTRPTVFQNSPNPFHPRTTIGFALPQAARASIKIYATGGGLVRTLVDAPFAAGYHELPWDGKNDAGIAASSGVYFYRLEAGGTTETRRLLLSK